MCGRAYSTYTDEEVYARYLNKKPPKSFEFRPNYNLSPTQDAPIVLVREGEKTIDLMRWGYIPPWEKEFKTKLSTINAKAETILESKLYKNAILKRRCVVPLSGFIEWKRDGEIKRPFCIYRNDKSIMSFAGIFGIWEGDGQARFSFSILTTEPNSFMKGIHDRMPVILDPKDEEAWLDPNFQDPKGILELTKPCASGLLEAYEVSTRINSPKNNSPEVLKPLTGEILAG